MARFNYGFSTGASRNKFRSGLGGRSSGRGGTRGPRPGRGGGHSFRGPSFRGGFSIDFTLNAAKSYFFDAQDWSKIFEPAEEKVLRMTGALLRRAAQGMIRKRKNPSRPGRSPSRWADRGAYAALTNILYAVDPWSKSVIVGPIFIGGTHKNVYTFPQPTIPATLEFGGSVRVGTATLTQSGNWLPKNRVVRIAPRPFMKPALEKKKDKIAELFLDIIGRTPQSVGIAATLRPAA